MAGVAVALVQLGPWHGTKAAPSIPDSKPAASLPPVQTPPPAVDTPKPPEPTPAAAIPTSPVQNSAPPSPSVAKPSPSQPKNIRAQIPAQPVRPTATPNQTPAQAVPAAPQPTAPVQQPPQQQQPTAPPVNRAELQETREQLVMLGARAGGIRSSLTSLQRSQAASGLNLRGDMQEAASLMDSFLQGANSAVNAGDVASAKSFMDKAERQVEKLEKFLNR
jgi:hypothetical protein